MIIKRMPMAVWSILLILLIGLSGCGEMDAHTTIFASEEWLSVIRVTLNSVEAGLVSDADLSKEEAKWKARGMSYGWRKEKDDPKFVYIITASGKGLGLLNEFMFSNEGHVQTTSQGIQIDVQNQGLLNPRSLTLRFTGGKIVESNADEIQGDTAIWWDVKSGDQVHVVLTEASKNPLPIWCLLGLGVGGMIVVIGFGVVLWKRFRTESEMRANSLSELDF